MTPALAVEVCQGGVVLVQQTVAALQKQFDQLGGTRLGRARGGDQLVRPVLVGEVARHSLHIADCLARVTCVAAFDGVAQGAGEPRQTRDLVAIRHHLQQQVIHIHPASGRRDGFGHRLVERLRGDVAHTSFGILRADVRHGL